MGWLTINPMSNSKKTIKKEKSELITEIFWKDKLSKELVQDYINKFRNSENICLIYTTQDQLDLLFTQLANSEKEKWKVFRDAFGRYYRWQRNNLDLVAVWTQFTKESFKEFFRVNYENASHHYSLASYAWNCLTKHKETWSDFQNNFANIRKSSLDVVFQKHYGGTLGPWLQTFQTGDFNDIYKIDINSCYNYQLGYSPLPIGNYTEIKDHRQIKKELAENKQGFLHFRLIGNDNIYQGNHYPWFPIERDGKKVWLEKIPNGIYLIHTCLLPHLLSDYSLNIRYLKFFVFEHKVGILQSFSDYYYAKKIEYSKGSWQNIIGKAVPNLVVGKFGEHYYRYDYQWEKGHLVQKNQKLRKGASYLHLMATIHAQALQQVLEEIKKYRKEDLLAVRTDCLIFKTKPIHTNIGDQIGQWKVKEVQQANFYDSNRLELDGEILAHGFKILERREKSVLVERQYYKEDGRLETKRYWKEL